MSQDDAHVPALNLQALKKGPRDPPPPTSSRADTRPKTARAYLELRKMQTDGFAGTSEAYASPQLVHRCPFVVSASWKPKDVHPGLSNKDAMTDHKSLGKTVETMGRTYPGMQWDGRDRFSSAETSSRNGKKGGTAHLSIGRYNTDKGSKMTLATAVTQASRNYKTALSSTQPKLTYHTMGKDPQLQKTFTNRNDYDTNRLHKASLSTQVFVSHQKYSIMRSKTPRFRANVRPSYSTNLGPGSYEKNHD
jgi:hypothetical protein